MRQTFVCRAIQGLTSVPACLSRIPDSGIVDLLLPLVSYLQLLRVMQVVLSFIRVTAYRKINV